MDKAGAIVKRGNEILLLFRHKEQDWTFPKGHIETGEDAQAAMIREIKEETGLDVRILQTLPDHFYDSVFEGLVRTKMFLVEPIDPSQPTRLEHPSDALRWVPMNQVTETLTYDNLKDYFVKRKLAII